MEEIDIESEFNYELGNELHYLLGYKTNWVLSDEFNCNLSLLRPELNLIINEGNK